MRLGGELPRQGPIQRPPSTGDINTKLEILNHLGFMMKLSAEREQADASVVRFPNGKPVPRKNQYYLQNNPDAAQQHAARQAAAAQTVGNAQKSIADIQARAAQAREKTKPEAPKPEPQRTEPVDTKPKSQSQPQVKQEPVPVPKPEEKKKKKPVETPNTQLPQE